MQKIALIAVLLPSAVAASQALAQSDAHDGHHPQQQGSAPPPATSVPSGAPGMGVMKMMGDGMDMSGMMQMMSRMHSSMGGCMSDAAFDHIEGRIAYLRTELHITDAQATTWNAFADVLPGQTQTSKASPSGSAERGSFLDRIARQGGGRAGSLDRVRPLNAAVTPTSSVISSS